MTTEVTAMSGHKNFKVLRDRLRSDPDAQALVEVHRRTVSITLALADLRESLKEASETLTRHPEGP